MRQSSVVNEWIDEGVEKGRRLERLEILEAMLTTRFGPLTDANLETLRAMSDDRLKALSLQLLTAKTLAELGL